MLGFDGVDVGLFEGRSHLWPSRVFADIARIGPGVVAQVGRSRVKARRRLSPDGPGLHLSRSESPGPSHTCSGARLVRAGRRVRLGMRWPARFGVAGRAVRERIARRFIEPVPRRTGMALRRGRATRHGFFRRGARRLDRAVAEASGSTCPRRARLNPDAGLHPLHQGGRRRRRNRAASGLRVAFPCPRRPAWPASGVVQGERHRLWPGSASDGPTGYAGYIGVEYVWIDWEHCNEVDNLSETILFRDFFRSHKITP